MAKKNKGAHKGPKPKEHIGLADGLLTIPALWVLTSPSDADPGGNAAVDRLGYVFYDDVPNGEWNLAGADLAQAGADAVDQLFSLQGATITLAAVGARHLIKHHTSASRHTLISGRHHKLTLGS